MIKTLLLILVQLFKILIELTKDLYLDLDFEISKYGTILLKKDFESI